MNTIKNFIAQEKAKLAPMRWSQRFSYFFTYYKGWLFGLVLVLLIGFYLGDAFLQNKIPIALQGFFTNDDYNLFPAGKIARDYGDTLPDLQGRIVFDDALYIDMHGEASDYAAASNGKILAYITTDQLDFVVTTWEVYDFLTQQLACMDLQTALPPDVFEALSDQMRTGTDRDGNQIFAALDMTNSRFVQQSPYAADAAGKYCLFLPHNAPNPQQVGEFVRYAFDLNA